SSLPNEPLWPRAGRSGMSAAMMSSSSLVAPSGNGLDALGPAASGGAPRRPNPTGLRSGTGRIRKLRLGCIGREGRCSAGVGHRSQALDPGEDAPFALVEPLLDVGREDEPAAGHPDPERDGHCVLRFVG